MKRIYRSRTDRKIAGICGGLAELWAMDPTLLRLLLVFLGLASGIMPLVITYLIAAWVIPLEPNEPSAGGRA